MTIICGHYGTGKTNLSVNLAVDAARAGNKVTLIDMDVVNPYFRSSDHKEMLEGLGVNVIAPAYANTNLEASFVTAEMSGAIGEGMTIIDVGGDDAGATVLGRFAKDVQNVDYDMWYVINRYRSMVADADRSVNMLHLIEDASGLKATGVVNNSHLKEETTLEMILGSLNYAERTSEAAGVPLIFTTCPRSMTDKLQNISTYPVDIYVRTVWDNEGEDDA